MRRVGASAPGKALLCGEYAVLEGAPAVVAAVDRRVTVRWTDGPTEMPPEVEETLALAGTRCDATPGWLELDVSELQHDRIKLGLGSSAAAAVATAGAVFATHGHPLCGETVHRVFECAFEGHAAVAPQGSGVDVAASAFGGFLRFRRDTAGIETTPLRFPSELSIALIWTGQAARTSELVAKVQALRREEPSLHGVRMGRLADLSSAFAGAFDSGNATEVVRCAAAYADAMRALGESAGVPIVERRLALAARLAERFAGSAKPCGAGGGDVAIAFFAEPAAADAFELACKDEGLHPVHVSWGASGVRTALPTH